MRKNTIIIRILVLIISLAIVLAGAEIFVRTQYKSQVNSILLAEQLRTISIRLLVQPSPDPVLYYVLKPDLDLVVHGAKVITDAEGCRVSGDPVDMPGNAVRIAVLGDSTSFGWKVDYDASYPELYRRALEANFNVPVVLKNYSVPGYNSIQEVETFAQKAIQFAPDLLIVHHDPNDPEPTSSFQPPKFLHPDYGNNPLNSALIKFVVRRYQMVKNDKAGQIDRDRHEYVNQFIAKGPLYEKHIEAFQRLKGITDKLDIPVIVLLYESDVKRNLPSLWKQDPVYVRLHRDLQDRLEPMGFHVLSLFPAYQRLFVETGWSDNRDFWISATDPVDGHPNPQGHAFIAETLLKYTLNAPEILKSVFISNTICAVNGGTDPL